MIQLLNHLFDPTAANTWEQIMNKHYHNEDNQEETFYLKENIKWYSDQHCLYY